VGCAHLQLRRRRSDRSGTGPSRHLISGFGTPGRKSRPATPRRLPPNLLPSSPSGVKTGTEPARRRRAGRRPVPGSRFGAPGRVCAASAVPADVAGMSDAHGENDELEFLDG
jgi:hypothetical protein